VAWTAPMTAVAGSVFTAAQFNQHLRDNLAETAPAKATTPGSLFAVTATNQIAERTPNAAVALSQDTTASTSYVSTLDLGSTGPSLTITTGVNAIVLLSASVSNSTTLSTRMAYDISGATTRAGADNRGIGVFGAAGNGINAGVAVLEQGLTPGVNVFTATYRVAGGTGTYNSRRLQVIPL
jgi:hypothetical protein